MDVVLVAPKGSGTTLRSLFLEGRGLNASVAVHVDASGQARERAFALGAAVGSGYMYETTFEKEVFSDLVGERGVLMGAIQGLFAAQYEVLRARGHSPSEAFNETVSIGLELRAGAAAGVVVRVIGGVACARVSGCSIVTLRCGLAGCIATRIRFRIRTAVLHPCPQVEEATQSLYPLIGKNGMDW